MNHPPVNPSDADLRQHSSSAERNSAPILAELQRLIPFEAQVLEVASGTGQHAATFGAAQPLWRWQPSEAVSASLASIDAWCAAVETRNVAPAMVLNIMNRPWPVDHLVDVVYCANLLHIAPPQACTALMAGAAEVLGPLGRLMLYGPFLQDGVPTAPGNRVFDTELKARNPAWGLRRLVTVEDTASKVGLRRLEVIKMPANNLMVVFGREGATDSAFAHLITI